MSEVEPNIRWLDAAAPLIQEGRFVTATHDAYRFGDIADQLRNLSRQNDELTAGIEARNKSMTTLNSENSQLSEQIVKEQSVRRAFEGAYDGLRFRAACAAIQGLISRADNRLIIGDDSVLEAKRDLCRKEVAVWAVAQADALLSALKENPVPVSDQAAEGAK